MPRLVFGFDDEKSPMPCGVLNVVFDDGRTAHIGTVFGKEAVELKEAYKNTKFVDIEKAKGLKHPWKRHNATCICAGCLKSMHINMGVDRVLEMPE